MELIFLKFQILWREIVGIVESRGGDVESGSGSVELIGERVESSTRSVEFIS